MCVCVCVCVCEEKKRENQSNPEVMNLLRRKVKGKMFQF